jgi:hypothetical protein
MALNTAKNRCLGNIQRVRMPLSKQKLNHSLYYKMKAIEKYGEKQKRSQFTTKNGKPLPK